MDRFPWVHAALQRLWAVVPPSPLGAEDGADQAEGRRWLGAVDSLADDVWVADPQGPFWLADYVRLAQPRPPHERTRGRPDTPASLVLRACDAYAARPCLGIPSASLQPVLPLPPPAGRDAAAGRPTVLARATSWTAMTAQAGAALTLTDGYQWLGFADLGAIVRCLSLGLRGLSGLREGAYVAIAGYNDFEFACADFAVAAAGMVSVGIHGTYSEDDAVAV